jgi:hypothetical protein
VSSFPSFPSFPNLTPTQTPRISGIPRNVVNFYENPDTSGNSIRMPMTGASVVRDYGANLNRFSFNFDRQIDAEFEDFMGPVLVTPTQNQIRNAIETIVFSEIIDPNNTRCPISLIPFEVDDTVTRIRYCGHIYLGEYLTVWFNQNVRCPLCRYDIRTYIGGNSDVNQDTTPTIPTIPPTSITPPINNINSGAASPSHSIFDSVPDEMIDGLWENELNDVINITGSISRDSSESLLEESKIDNDIHPQSPTFSQPIHIPHSPSIDTEIDNTVEPDPLLTLSPMSQLLHITDGMSSIIGSMTDMYTNPGTNNRRTVEPNTTEREVRNETIRIIESVVNRQIDDLRPFIESTNAVVRNVSVEVTTPIDPRPGSRVPLPTPQPPPGPPPNPIPTSTSTSTSTSPTQNDHVTTVSSHVSGYGSAPDSETEDES